MALLNLQTIRQFLNDLDGQNSQILDELNDLKLDNNNSIEQDEELENLVDAFQEIESLVTNIQDNQNWI